MSTIRELPWFLLTVYSAGRDDRLRAELATQAGRYTGLSSSQLRVMAQTLIDAADQIDRPPQKWWTDASAPHRYCGEDERGHVGKCIIGLRSGVPCGRDRDDPIHRVDTLSHA